MVVTKLLFIPQNIKTMGKNVHVVKHPQGWAAKVAGNEKATKVTATQKEAENAAIKIATNQKSEVVIHGRDGKIREKNSYGNDPSKIKG
jgi:hypothetical protein